MSSLCTARVLNIFKMGRTNQVQERTNILKTSIIKVFRRGKGVTFLFLSLFKVLLLFYCFFSSVTKSVKVVPLLLKGLLNPYAVRVPSLRRRSSIFSVKKVTCL